MLWTILIAIFFAVAIVALVIAVRKSKQIKAAEKDNSYGRVSNDLYNSRAWAWGTASVSGVIAIVLLIMSTISIVSTKNVGIVTSFGRPTGDVLSNGLHLKAPWEDVTEFDAAIQTQDYKGDGCTTVRLGTEGKACVDNSVQWRIIPDAASGLFTDYRSFEAMSSALVDRQRVSALNAVFASFDPLAKIKSDNAGAGVPTLAELGDQAKARLQELLGDRLAVDSVVISLVKYDDGTQAKIDAYQAEVAATRIAEQRHQTAQADAVANRKLAESVSKDPNVLVSKCLDTLADMQKAGQQVPAGFSCWPGGGSAIVVPSGSNTAK
jgi:regulator of protease activity HflC (stomatin/prohibitin superfamily)